jgi:hypothetical protein
MPQLSVDRTGHRGAGPAPFRRPLCRLVLPRLSHSLLQHGVAGRRGHVVADAALMAATRARLGWAPAWSVAHVARPIIEQEFKVTSPP